MTGPTPGRRRAPSMSPELRRQMIVRSTLSLITEHGLAVTTGRIARAAAISEATIFHVFSDKDELLDACVAEAARSDDVVYELADIPLDAPVTARLVAAAGVLEAYLTRVGTVITYLEAGGHGRARRYSAAPAGGMREVREAFDSVVASLAALLGPEEESLRLPAPHIAQAFFDLLFARTRNPDYRPHHPQLVEIVQLLVHGSLAGSSQAETAGAR
ncbi:TetR/AcrR family transcriptional regulator [Streptomyces xantholiticus]|uniref:TetR/AcrR family transcriptional regulator n=1 Tax=Streptomyces xantholiticus TaxID=68285 RepID=A0ABV1V6A8_9ACTN